MKKVLYLVVLALTAALFMYLRGEFYLVQSLSEARPSPSNRLRATLMMFVTILSGVALIVQLALGIGIYFREDLKRLHRRTVEAMRSEWKNSMSSLVILLSLVVALIVLSGNLLYLAWSSDEAPPVLAFWVTAYFGTVWCIATWATIVYLGAIWMKVRIKRRVMEAARNYP